MLLPSALLGALAVFSSNHEILAWITVVVLIVALFVSHRRAKHERMTHSYLQQFTPIEGTSHFHTSSPIFHDSRTKVPHAVLLVHGYSASPDEFTALSSKLADEGIPHYAPLLTGHGMSDMRLMSAASHQDWIRDVCEGYRVLSKMANKVSVVGMSVGGLLSLLVDTECDFHSVILCGLNLSKLDTNIERQRSVYSVLKHLEPVYVKGRDPVYVSNRNTLDESMNLKAFHYPALPTSSGICLLNLLVHAREKLQNSSHHSRHIFLLWGDNDLGGKEKTEQFLKDAHYEFETTVVERCGHNLLEDFGKEEAQAKIIGILKNVK